MAQSSASGTSSRRCTRDHEVGGSSSSRYNDSEWDTKEALRQRELEEARARAAQMEKTMRWWSDCTANWREKWSKVRNERNMAREEAKSLRAKLETATKDSNNFKHEYQVLEHQNEQLRKELDKIHMILLKHARQFDQQIFTALESDLQLRNILGLDEFLESNNSVENNSKGNSQKDPIILKNPLDSPKNGAGSHEIPDRDIEEYVLQGAVPKHAVELYKENSITILDRDVEQLVSNFKIRDNTGDDHQSSIDDSTEDELKQKVEMLQLTLDEACKATSAEREEKNSLHRTLEKLKAEVVQLREQCEQLRVSKADVVKELKELREKFKIELTAAQADLVDETSNRESMDRRLTELRTELEKLQAENAAEWNLREQLETEKISLERENKKLRNELYDLQNRLESRRNRPVSISDSDSRQLQQELADCTKELAELKHSQMKLKKMLGEKTTELCHAIRRSEQYETEVKRVRARVEELKKELATAQDEVDGATDSIRKLERSNEDLLEQLKSANVELEHLRNNVKTQMQK